MKLHEQIKAAREARGWEKEELAKRMNVSKTSVTLWESGKGIRIERLQLLEGVLGVKFNPTETKPIGIPEFVTPKGLMMMERISKLPVKTQDAIWTLVLACSHIHTYKNKVEPLMEDLGEISPQAGAFLLDTLDQSKGDVPDEHGKAAHAPRKRAKRNTVPGSGE